MVFILILLFINAFVSENLQGESKSAPTESMKIITENKEPTHTFEEPEEKIICDYGFKSDNYVYGESDTRIGLLRNYFGSVDGFITNYNINDNSKSKSQFLGSYCTSLSNNLIHIAENPQTVDGTEKFKKCWLRGDKKDFLFISTQINHKIIFSQRNLIPIKDTNSDKFDGKFVSLESFNEINPDNEYKQCLELHGLSSEGFKIFLRSITLRKTENSEPEEISLIGGNLLSIFKIYENVDNSEFFYKIESSKDRGPKTEFCTVECEENEIPVFVKNGETKKCSEKSAEDSLLKNINPFCACQNFDLSHSKLLEKNYVEKSTEDFKCEKDYFQSKKNYKKKCPSEKESVCLLPVCPTNVCEGSQSNGVCSFKLKENEVAFDFTDIENEVEKNGDFQCVLKDENNSSEKRVILSLGCNFSQNIALPSDSDCILKSKNSAKKLLKSACEFEVPEGKFIKTSGSDTLFKKFKINCSSLPDSLSIEKLKCVPEVFSIDHAELETKCKSGNIEVGATCKYFCDKGYKLSNNKSGHGVATCKEQVNEGIVHTVFQHEDITCITDESEEDKNTEKPDEDKNTEKPDENKNTEKPDENKNTEKPDENIMEHTEETNSNKNTIIILVVVFIACVLIITIFVIFAAKKKKKCCFKEKHPALISDEHMSIDLVNQ